jgi:hypothetical protein
MATEFLGEMEHEPITFRDAANHLVAVLGSKQRSQIRRV